MNTNQSRVYFRACLYTKAEQSTAQSVSNHKTLSKHFQFLSQCFWGMASAEFFLLESVFYSRGQNALSHGLNQNCLTAPKDAGRAGKLELKWLLYVRIDSRWKLNHMWAPTFRIEYFKVSHSAHFLVWISIFVLIFYRRKLLWWWLSETRVYGYSRMPLVAILLQHSLDKNSIWFSPRSMAFLVSGYWHPSSVRNVFYLMEGALNKIR